MLTSHVGVDLVQGAQELGPEGGVVAFAERDEVPRGVLRPLVRPFVAAEIRAGSGPAQSTEAVVEHAVQTRRFGIDPDVLGRRVNHELAEVTHDVTGSICCQNRCDASSSTPTLVVPVEIDELMDRRRC